MPQPDLPAHHILQQAAQWFATMLDEDVSQQDRDQWQAWLNAHPEHQRAWHYVEQVGQRFQQARNNRQEQPAPGKLSMTPAAAGSRVEPFLAVALRAWQPG